MKTILSLFDYSGNWPYFYKQAGYDVYSLDIKNGFDILELQREDLPEHVHGVLAAPIWQNHSNLSKTLNCI